MHRLDESFCMLTHFRGNIIAISIQDNCNYVSSGMNVVIHNAHSY